MPNMNIKVAASQEGSNIGLMPIEVDISNNIFINNGWNIDPIIAVNLNDNFNLTITNNTFH